jgi:hypothetical protein
MTWLEILGQLARTWRGKEEQMNGDFQAATKVDGWGSQDIAA